MASISPPKSFNYIASNESSTSLVLGFIYGGLTDTDPATTEVMPGLAESWDVKNDGQTYVMHLRKDVKWNDGQPFTAEDVEFTFNDLIYNDKISNPSRDIFTIDGKKFNVKAVDKDTVQFDLPTKFAPFLRAVGTAILPKHSLKEIVDRGEFEHSLGVNADPSEIIGTGPYMLEEYQAGQRVVLKRNPHYWKNDGKGNQLPYLDKVVIEIVQNEDVELMKFLQKELDYYGLRGQDFPELKPKEQDGNFTVYITGTSTNSQFIFFNQNTGMNDKGKPYVAPHKLKWFRDVRFRQAVAYAIDREGIIEVLMNGLGEPQWSPESPANASFYNSNVPKYPFNIAKAKKILADAGFRDRNGDGFVEDAEGNMVEFTLTTNAENTVRVRMAEMIRKDLQNIGFKVSFLPLQFNMLVSKLDSNFDWEAMILGLGGGDIDPHFSRNVWISSGYTHMWFPKQKTPSTKWEARLNELFDSGVQELDPAKRKAIYNEYQMIAAEQLPLIFTVHSKQIQAVRNTLGNIHPTAYAGAFHDIERIYIK